MGYCEQRLMFEKTLGEKLTDEQKIRIREGNKAHDRFFREGLALGRSVSTSKDKPWCFVATQLFGPDAPETWRLRRYRDELLRRSPAGRAAIRLYYAVSPTIAQWLRGREWASKVMRFALRGLLRFGGERRTSRW